MSVLSVRVDVAERLVMAGDYAGAAAVVVTALKESGRPFEAELDRFAKKMQVALSAHPQEFNKWLRALRIAVRA